MSTPPRGTLVAPPNRTWLVEDLATPQPHSSVRETDTRTALTRGLSEYLQDTILVDQVGGRQFKFYNVFQAWSEPEENARYPSAVVYASGAGSYDASSFTPSPNERCRLPDGRYAMAYAEFVQDLMVEVWANDPTERADLCAACEDAFNPVSFMYGFVLALPHYYNLRGTFAMQSVQYMDTEENAIRRYRLATFVLKAEVPLVRLVSFPGAKARVRLDAVGTDVIVT